MKHVLLDVDGVLANFIGRVCEIASSITGRAHKPEDIKQFSFAAELGLTPEQKREVHGFIEKTGFWRNLEPYPEAIEGVRLLRAMRDVEITIVTSPWNSCRTWLHEREEWLKQHFDIHHGDVIPTSKKHMVCGKILVDDKTETLHKWRKVWGGGAVQWQTPHNRFDAWDGHSTRDWNRLAQIVEQTL